MSFSDIVGHEAVIRLLQGQLKADRLPQAVLMVGPEGIGKRTLALEFAKALECERAPDGQACEACEPCRKVAQGTHPDLLTVGPESGTGQIRIDQIRRLEAWAVLTPYGGRRKVGLIEEAEHLTEEATHACLKLLEEPPQRSLLILISTAPHRLPATVVSRCHLVRCRPQGIGRVISTLRQRQRLDLPLATMLANASGGRLGLALSLCRQKRLEANNAALDQFLTAFRKGGVEIPLGTAPRTELEEALEWLAGWWRDLLVLKLGGHPSWLIHQDRIGALRDVIASPAGYEQTRDGPHEIRSDISRGRQSRIGIASSSPLGTPRNDEVDELLNRVERTYRVQRAIQANASPRIALAALLSRQQVSR